MSLSKLRKVPSFSEPECSQPTSTPEDVKVKQTRKLRVWEMDLTYDTKEAAEEIVEEENTWRIQTTYNTKQGERVNYYCNSARQQEQSACHAHLQLLYHCDSLKVTVFRSGDHIDHSAVCTENVKKGGIPKGTKEEIERLFQDGVQKPNGIIEALRKHKITEPTKSQLTSFLSYIKKKKYGPATANVKYLLDWCESHRRIPTCDDEPFVVGKHITVASDIVEHLRICLSTKRLLSFVRYADVLHADSTYKLNWNGYPVLIVGTSDKNRVFHPMSISICYQEEAEDYEFIFGSLRDQAAEVHKLRLDPGALMADGSTAITNGFESTFGKCYVRLMCYFHLIKCVDTHIRCFIAEIRTEIKSDIAVLQLAASDEEFNRAAELFMNKWKDQSKTSLKIAEFLEYFEKQWLQAQRFWYEGAYLNGPSTNNGLEATNAVIKRDHTFRERLTVQQFLSLIVEKLLPSWSIARNPANVNFKEFAVNPQITLETWTKAYQWAKSKITLLSEEVGPTSHTYYAASSDFQKSTGQVDETIISQYKTGIASSLTFDEYSKHRKSLWLVTITDDRWLNAKCNCPVFLKRYVCKHTVGLGIRLGLTDAPLHAKNILLGQNRKRGRPSKAKLALVV